MLLDHLSELRNRGHKNDNPLYVKGGVELKEVPKTYKRPPRSLFYKAIHPLDVLGLEHYHAYMRDGDDLMKMEAYLDAAGAYNLAIGERPRSVIAYEGVFNALLQLGGRANAELAASYLYKALQIDFERLDLFDEYIYVLEKLGRKNEAIDFRRKRFTIRAYQADPRNAMLRNNVGVVLMSLGEVLAAIRFFQLALVIQPQLAAARLNLAKSWLQLSNQTKEKVLENKYLQNAEEALNGFYTEETAAMQLLRGKIALHQAKYHQAKEFLENAYKLSPSEKEIYGTLQLVHEKLGNIQAAVDAHETYSLLKQEETQQRKRKKFSFLRVKAKPQE